MKDNLVEDIIKISSQLRADKELLCNKYYKNYCNNCPLDQIDDCTNIYSLSCLEYNDETGKYE